MLTQDQSNYLATIPDDKVAHIKPYTPRLKELAYVLIRKIHRHHPELEAFFGGAAALGIGGQNDLDVDFLTIPQDFKRYLPTFTQLFGKPRACNDSAAGWSFTVEGVEVDLWLTDKTSPTVQEQQQIFRILQKSSPLLREYEKLKQSFDGKSYKDYQQAKYEFYNRLLKEE